MTSAIETAGKKTLLNLLVGLLRPSEGELEVFGGSPPTPEFAVLAAAGAGRVDLRRRGSRAGRGLRRRRGAHPPYLSDRGAGRPTQSSRAG
jgi:hypothetical protein